MEVPALRENSCQEKKNTPFLLSSPLLVALGALMSSEQEQDVGLLGLPLLSHFPPLFSPSPRLPPPPGFSRASLPSASRPPSSCTQVRLSGRGDGRLRPPGSGGNVSHLGEKPDRFWDQDPLGVLVGGTEPPSVHSQCSRPGQRGSLPPTTVRGPGDRSVKNLDFGAPLRGRVEPRETEPPALRS